MLRVQPVSRFSEGDCCAGQSQALIVGHRALQRAASLRRSEQRPQRKRDQRTSTKSPDEGDAQESAPSIEVQPLVAVTGTEVNDSITHRRGIAHTRMTTIAGIVHGRTVQLML